MPYSNIIKLAFTWLVYLITVCVMLAVVGSASAKIGFATGIGPHLSNPLTPHVGRVYWKPGDKVSHAAERAPMDAVDQYVAEYGNPKKDAHKVNCDKLESEYMLRHGVTTPRPLKGFHGCQKAAMDHNYWHANTPVNPFTTRAAVLQVAISVHNVVLPW